MRFYNTLTKKIDDFKPKDNLIKMYTCGPTVYNYAHIGNLRTYIFEDNLEKGLVFLGYDVKRVMNITDVGHLEGDSDTGEDKMRKEAEKSKRTMREIADYYTDAFFKDFESLNIKKPNIISRASDNIDIYINHITDLIDKGYAYVADNNNVYFDVVSFPNYYELSGINPDDLIVGARDGVDFDKHKKNQTDFALWFVDSKFKDQEMKWDSPWGIGYPGWHIECSSIARKYLGDSLDIHCGGVDNIFPHHTNEIAQAEAAIGKEWCELWMHGAHLVLKDEKMSKSLGNILTVTNISEYVHPLSYRLFCLMGHYRKELMFSKDALIDANNTLQKLYSRINLIERDGEIVGFEPYIEEFKEAISNDLNTSLMVTSLYNVLKSDLNGNTKLYLIEEFDKVLSLDLIQDEIVDKEIIKLLAKRDEYKKNKEFEKADNIRDEIKAKGYKIIDTKEGGKVERRV